MSKKIAIIDDDESILKMLKSYLSRREEFLIDTYSSASDCVSRISNGNYDLVISDITMPKMTGIELLQIIKEKNPNQKILLMTAHSSEEKIIKSYKLEADDYLTKPFITLRDVENKILDNLGL